MQHDEMIWSVISQNFCSFKTTIGKAKSDKTHFCKNPYSVTGLCNRTSCPLANSKYATIREDNGRIHLYMKTVERAHSPKNTWEKILLSRNYSKALAQLDEHLQYFPKVLMHRNKQRLTKIHQYLIRMRKIELKARSGRKAKLVGVHRKIDQREERRERKALVAAKLEQTIEKELVERLAKGTYGDIYNFPETPYRKALEKAEDTATEQDSQTEMEEEEEDDDESVEGMVEYVEDLNSEDEQEMEDDEDIENMEYLGNGNWGENDDSDDDDSDSDDDSSSSGSKRVKKPSASKPKKPAAKPKGPRVEIEYEEEREDQAEPVVAEAAW